MKHKKILIVLLSALMFGQISILKAIDWADEVNEYNDFVTAVATAPDKAKAIKKVENKLSYLSGERRKDPSGAADNKITPTWLAQQNKVVANLKTSAPKAGPAAGGRGGGGGGAPAKTDLDILNDLYTEARALIDSGTTTPVDLARLEAIATAMARNSEYRLDPTWGPKAQELMDYFDANKPAAGAPAVDVNALQDEADTTPGTDEASLKRIEVLIGQIRAANPTGMTNTGFTWPQWFTRTQQYVDNARAANKKGAGAAGPVKTPLMMAVEQANPAVPASAAAKVKLALGKGNVPAPKAVQDLIDALTTIKGASPANRTAAGADAAFIAAAQKLVDDATAKAVGPGKPKVDAAAVAALVNAYNQANAAIDKLRKTIGAKLLPVNFKNAEKESGQAIGAVATFDDALKRSSAEVITAAKLQKTVAALYKELDVLDGMIKAAKATAPAAAGPAKPAVEPWTDKDFNDRIEAFNALRDPIMGQLDDDAIDTAPLKTTALANLKKAQAIITELQQGLVSSPKAAAAVPLTAADVAILIKDTADAIQSINDLIIPAAAGPARPASPPPAAGYDFAKAMANLTRYTDAVDAAVTAASKKDAESALNNARTIFETIKTEYAKPANKKAAQDAGVDDDYVNSVTDALKTLQDSSNAIPAAAPAGPARPSTPPPAAGPAAAPAGAAAGTGGVEVVPE